MRLVAFFSLFFVLFSCQDDDINNEQFSESQEVAIENYLEDQQIDSASTISTEDGNIYYYPVEYSSSSDPSEVGDNSVVSFRYQIAALDGPIFSSLANSPTILAKLNSAALVPAGLDIALRESGQKTGDIYTYIIPSILAYRGFEVDGILPANSVVILTIELLDVRNERQVLEDQLIQINQFVTSAGLDDQSRYPIGEVERYPATGIIKKTLAAPTDNAMPAAGDIATITYTLTYSDSTFIENVTNDDPFDFVVGGSDTGTGAEVIPGLDFVVSEMQTGERAIVVMPSNQAYNESAQVVPVIFKDPLVTENVIPRYAAKIDPYRILVFDLQLRGIN